MGPGSNTRPRQTKYSVYATWMIGNRTYSAEQDDFSNMDEAADAAKDIVSGIPQDAHVKIELGYYDE